MSSLVLAALFSSGANLWFLSPTLSRGYDISGHRHADRSKLSK
jgi:hypothetical protein